MPKISQEHGDNRQMQILEAAWRCFYRAGLHETTMQDIIRQSDLSAGAVYLFFPSKEEIILTAIGTSLSQVRALLSELLGKDDYDNSPAIVSAIQAYAKINANGQWIDRVEGVSRNELFDRMTKEELETYAREHHRVQPI